MRAPAPQPKGHQTHDAALRVRLLGELALDLGGRPLGPIESARARSLPGYLVFHREAPQARQRLAFLFWPDSTEAQARTNLRKAFRRSAATLQSWNASWRSPPRRCSGCRADRSRSMSRCSARPWLPPPTAARTAGLETIRQAIETSGSVNHAPGFRAALLRLSVAAQLLAGDAEGGLAAANAALLLGGTRLWEADVRLACARFLADLGRAEAEG